MNDSEIQTAICQCGQLRRADERLCGRCPQRRATDAEIEEMHAFFPPGTELPFCRRKSCERVLKLSAFSAPNQPVLCYECYRETTRYSGNPHTAKCEHPKHRGSNNVPREYLEPCAVRKQSRKQFGAVHFPQCCFACKTRYGLSSKEKYLYDNGDVDPDTGEVIPAIQDAGMLLLEPSLPFPESEELWSPSTLTINVNGNLESPWILFDPYRWFYFQHKGKRCRAIGAHFIAHNTKSAMGARTKGNVWCPGINRVLDELMEIGSFRREKIYNCGPVYARAVNVTDSGSLIWFVSRLSTSGLNMKEWLHNCERNNEQ